MARTKASVGAKVSSGKSQKARCSAAPPASPAGGGAGGSGLSGSGGGNPVCPRETPRWQRPITTFFVSKPTRSPCPDHDADGVSAGGSRARPRRNVIHSDEEESLEITDPQHLEPAKAADTPDPLDGDNTHPHGTTAKGKGTGKKTKQNNSERDGQESQEERGESPEGSNKENHHNNTEIDESRERSNKREREESLERDAKRIRIGEL